ncbi:MAG: trigger factor [Bacilli bacterium]|jgi:trigger factor|nr:trigger factor [Bacilli bacterium]
MKHSVEKVSESRVKVTVDVDKEAWKAGQEKSFRKLSAKVSVPGFRPGKAPEQLLREHVSQSDIWDDAIQGLLQTVFAEVLKEEKLQPYFRPNVSVSKIDADELQIVFELILVPSVTLGEYKGLSEKKEAPALTDKEVDEAIAKLLAGNGTLALVDRPAKDGDTVTLDFEGFLPDEKGALAPFEGGKADNYALELGSHSFVPGFEEAIVGLKAGESKDIKVKFPENYVKQLAGKEATFKVAVHEIKEKRVPELNEESVKALKIADVANVDQLKEYEKKTLLAQKVRESEQKYYSAIVAKIVKNAKVTIDPEVIKAGAASLEDNLKKRLEQQSLTLEQYLQITGEKEDDLKGKFAVQAENEIKEFAVLSEIALAEKIVVTDADVDAEIKRMAAEYKLKEEDVKGYLAKNMDGFRNNLQDKKVHDFIVSVSK